MLSSLAVVMCSDCREKEEEKLVIVISDENDKEGVYRAILVLYWPFISRATHLPDDVLLLDYWLASQEE